MGTIADKLTYLGETKSDLRATLNGLLGLSLDADTPFRQYAYEADMAALRAMFSEGELGGYWEPTLESYYEDSAGTTAAGVNGVVGAWTNQISGGPSAVQATTANKPYLRKTPQTNRYWLDGNTSTANLTVSFPSSLGSSCTIARLDPELGVQWSESQTIGTTYNLITPYAYHGPMLIINRALTAQEKAIVARAMNRFMPQLGPELVTNGTFDTGVSGWNIASGGGSIAWDASGSMIFTRSGATPTLLNAGAESVIGKAYFLTIKIQNKQELSSRLRVLYGCVGIPINTPTPIGYYRMAGIASSALKLQMNIDNKSDSYVIDDVSVMEII